MHQAHVEREDDEVGDCQSIRGDKARVRTRQVGLNLLVEGVELGGALSDLGLIGFTHEPHKICLRVPKVCVRLKRPIHVESLVHVVVEVVAVSATKQSQDSSGLVQDFASFSLLPDGHLAGRQRWFDLRPLLKGDFAIDEGDAFVRKQHADRLALGM